MSKKNARYYTRDYLSLQYKYEYFSAQMLEVELVSADGSFVVANAEGTWMKSADGSKQHITGNTDLFWALRGGGGSTW